MPMERDRLINQLINLMLSQAKGSAVK